MPKKREYTEAQRKAAVRRVAEWRKHNERKKEYNKRGLARYLAWVSNKPDQHYYIQRRSKLLRKYGLTEEQFNVLLQTQNGKCKICGVTPTSPSGKGDDSLHVDHDHITGRVRGLLCKRCNTGLGFFSDRIELLEQAVNYLRS